MLTLQGAGHEMNLTAVSPDTNVIGAMSGDGILSLWRAPSWEGIRAAPYAEIGQKQRECARKGLELDDTLPETLIQDAYVKLIFDWDWAGAEHQFQRAITANPNYVFAHDEYVSLLMWSGRFEEALAEEKKALELDPASAILYVDLAGVFQLAGRHEEAVAAAQKAMDLDPNLAQAYWIIANSYLEQARFAQALAMFEKARSLEDTPDVELAIARAYAKSGNRTEARKRLASLQESTKQNPVQPTALARVHLALGDRERALELLEKAVASRDQGCVWFKVDLALTPMRNEPRFRALLKKIGFPE